MIDCGFTKENRWFRYRAAAIIVENDCALFACNETTQLVLDTLKQVGKYSKVDLCYIEGNIAAKKLYEQFGFVKIDRDGNEIIMELCI